MGGGSKRGERKTRRRREKREGGRVGMGRERKGKKAKEDRKRK